MYRFVLGEIMLLIEGIKARIARFDARLLEELKDEWLHGLSRIAMIAAASLSRKVPSRPW